MNYNIKGTELAVVPELRAYVERALAHADKLVRGETAAHADVELEYSAMRDGGRYRAEFNLSLRGEMYRAERWGTTLHEAIDLAAGELAGELRRGKERRLRVFRRGAVRVKEFLRGWRSRL